MIHNFRVVLRAYAGEELSLRLWDAEPLEGLLDLIRHVIPRLLFALGWLPVVHDLRKIELGEIATPVRHGTRLEVLIGAEAVLQHPGRFVLRLRDLADGRLGEARLGFAEVGDVVVEGVLLPLVSNVRIDDRHAAPFALTVESRLIVSGLGGDRTLAGERRLQPINQAVNHRDHEQRQER